MHTNEFRFLSLISTTATLRPSEWMLLILGIQWKFRCRNLFVWRRIVPEFARNELVFVCVCGYWSYLCSCCPIKLDWALSWLMILLINLRYCQLTNYCEMWRKWECGTREEKDYEWYNGHFVADSDFFFILKKIPQSNYFYVQSSIAVIFIDLIKNQDIIISFELSECVSVPVCGGAA